MIWMQKKDFRNLAIRYATRMSCKLIPPASGMKIVTNYMIS